MQGGGECISGYLSLRSKLISGSCQERRGPGASTPVNGYAGSGLRHQGNAGSGRNGDGTNHALIRLLGSPGAVLLEQHEHWQLEGRRMFSADSMAAISELDDIPALQALSA